MVRGVAVDTNGNGLPGIVVSIRTAEGKLFTSVTTGEGGAYEFPAVPVGQYEVFSEFAGYTTVSPVPVKVTPSGLAMPPAARASLARRPRRAAAAVSELGSNLAILLVRELATFERELALYPDDESLWKTTRGMANSAGNLALHVAGNLQHFVGAVLGGTGYARNRELEFGRRSGSRERGRRGAAGGGACAVREVLPALSEERLAAMYPEKLNGLTLRTDRFLMHLCAHAGYHLGQASTLRRVLTGDGSLERTGAARGPDGLTARRCGSRSSGRAAWSAAGCFSSAWTIRASRPYWSSGARRRRLRHAKLEEILHPDFFDFSTLRDPIRGARRLLLLPGHDFGRARPRPTTPVRPTTSRWRRRARSCG